MSLSIELGREPTLTVSQWERFLGQARHAGASGDSPVAEVMSTGSDDIIHRYRVEIRDQGTLTAREEVTLPARLVQDLLHVVSEVAKSDGDVRGLEGTAGDVVQEAYDLLLVPVLGTNYLHAEEPSDG